MNRFSTVAMDHVFLWRFYAGIAFAVFAYAIVRCFVSRGCRKIRVDRAVHIHIMVAVEGRQHFVKFRQ